MQIGNDLAILLMLGSESYLHHRMQTHTLSHPWGKVNAITTDKNLSLHHLLLTRNPVDSSNKWSDSLELTLGFTSPVKFKLSRTLQEPREPLHKSSSKNPQGERSEQPSSVSERVCVFLHGDISTEEFPLC